MDVADIAKVARRLVEALSGVLVGQRIVVEESVAALIAGGHVLLEGAPGTGKTLLVRAVARAVSGNFRRIQFTPDLMPSDITGVNVYREASGTFDFVPGPVFADVLLADEINRAPAKTQAALLEAMQEGQVTVDGERHPLPPAFTTFATQNPIEYEGTYPLPEAQLDRFLLKSIVPHPPREEEERILLNWQSGFDASRPETFGMDAVTSPEELVETREALHAMPVAREIVSYVVALVRATRGFHQFTLGASPRASVMLLHASKALAVVRGREFVSPDDVRDAVLPALRHRVVLTPEAEVEGGTADEALARVAERVEVPRG